MKRAAYTTCMLIIVWCLPCMLVSGRCGGTLDCLKVFCHNGRVYGNLRSCCLLCLHMIQALIHSTYKPPCAYAAVVLTHCLSSPSYILGVHLCMVLRLWFVGPVPCRRPSWDNTSGIGFPLVPTKKTLKAMTQASGVHHSLLVHFEVELANLCQLCAVGCSVLTTWIEHVLAL